MPSTLVILGTGGTIAGTAADPADNVGYTAAQRSVQELLAAVPTLGDASRGAALECEQVAQVDSKDMDHAIWQHLARRVAHHLGRPEVCGVVITHGTDTLEETAWLLHRVLAPAKPVVLTAAMRPATALAADGPQNLLDAVRVAATPAARGVVVVAAGTVHGAADVRKQHPYRVDAFGSGDAGAIGRMEEGQLRQHRPWPEGQALGVQRLAAPTETWPRVEVVTSHGGADGTLVRALLTTDVRGLVVASTGNGTVHHALEAAMDEARRRGVEVWRCTRCAQGVLVGPAAQSPAAALSPWQARIELMLHLMA